MIIKILGGSCACSSNCNASEVNVKKALSELKKDAEIINVTDIVEIMKYGVMSTPAIVIDEKVKAYGRVSTVEEIKEWLK